MKFKSIALLLLSWILVFGSAGSYIDLNLISTSTFITFELIGFALMIAAVQLDYIEFKRSKSRRYCKMLIRKANKNN